MLNETCQKCIYENLNQYDYPCNKCFEDSEGFVGKTCEHCLYNCFGLIKSNLTVIKCSAFTLVSDAPYYDELCVVKEV